VRDPDLVDRLVDAFGSQCVVVGIDSIGDAGAWTTRQMTGDPDRMETTGRRTLEWIEEVAARGAGEIVLNCMGADGTRAGYDIEQLRAARAITDLPLIASGGAGTRDHFIEAFTMADVDGALAATVFHSGAIPIPELKQTLASAGVGVRPC
jgi:cyclase